MNYCTKIQKLKLDTDITGYAWITDGREIENYLPGDGLKEAINMTMPSAKINSGFGQYENTLSVITKGGKASQASKVDVAKYITGQTLPDLEILDLNRQIKRLVSFIEESNPNIHAVELWPLRKNKRSRA